MIEAFDFCDILTDLFGFPKQLSVSIWYSWGALIVSYYLLVTFWHTH